MYRIALLTKKKKLKRSAITAQQISKSLVRYATSVFVEVALCLPLQNGNAEVRLRGKSLTLNCNTVS